MPVDAERWLHTARDAASPEQQLSAAAVSIAFSLHAIADALTSGPRPNAGEKTYTGPVRVPDADPSPAQRASGVRDPFRGSGPVPETHPSVVLDRQWWEETTQRSRRNAERLLTAAKANRDAAGIRQATDALNALDIEARHAHSTYSNETEWPIPEERPNPLDDPAQH